MRGLSVVIPSKTATNLAPCVEAVRRHGACPRDILVIDDGLNIESAELEAVFFEIDPFPALRIIGDQPFVFARNINRGIRRARENDVILLNDDALLRTPGGFTAMRRAAEENPEYGIISATTNLAGNTDQFPQGIGLRDAGSKCVAFVCVLIPRRTIDAVGLLDERFTAYGWEDNDYCRRVRMAGLKVGIFDGCYVDHGSLKSTFRGEPTAAGNIYAGQEIYLQKWGDLA